jgi:hypothetical protein
LLIPPKTPQKIDVELPIEFDQPDADPENEVDQRQEPAEIKRA